MEHKNPYPTFFLMLAASFFIMYGVMFLNVARYEHIYLSTTRLYMTLLMVSPMALLMLSMMKSMYRNKRMNTLIAAGSIAVFGIVLFLLRNQTFIADRQYMQAMIPHHSSAIMTSQNATLHDPEVRKLSEEIIAAQEREIAQMKRALDRLENTGK